jgi:hypothetical protein
MPGSSVITYPDWFCSPIRRRNPASQPPDAGDKKFNSRLVAPTVYTFRDELDRLEVPTE